MQCLAPHIIFFFGKKIHAHLTPKVLLIWICNYMHNTGTDHNVVNSQLRAAADETFINQSSTGITRRYYTQPVSAKSCGDFSS